MRNKETKYVDFSQFEGFIAPVDVEMEQVVLGACMLEIAALLEVSSYLIPDIFSRPAHVEICRAILTLHDKKEKVDILTVANQLRSEKLLTYCGGAYYVAGLTNRVGSSANIEFHVRILHQKSIQRQTIEAGYELVRGGYNDLVDPFDLLDNAEAAIKGISAKIQQSENEIKTFADLVKVEYDAHDIMNGGGATGVNCGILPIDNAFGSFMPGTLTYIAARPSLGKSVLARCIGKGAAKLGSKVAAFSLEMSALEYIQCMIADEANINLETIAKGKATDDQRRQINLRMGQLLNIGLYVDDRASNSVKNIWAKCNRLKSTVGLDMVIVDYLQLIPTPELPSGINENTRLEYISRNLKLMAKDLGVPVIALCQLNRDLEKRPSKRPLLSDLRGSGAIEQDADIVIMLYRPEWYNIEVDSETNAVYEKGYAELLVEKYKMGEKGVIPMFFHGAYQRFSNQKQSTYETQFPLSDTAMQRNTNFDINRTIEPKTKDVPF